MNVTKPGPKRTSATTLGVAIFCLLAAVTLLGLSLLTNPQTQKVVASIQTTPILSPPTSTPTLSPMKTTVAQAVTVAPAYTSPTSGVVTEVPFLSTTGDDEKQYLNLAGITITVYMPATRSNNEPAMQLIVAFADQPEKASLDALVEYASQQSSVLIVPTLDYASKNTKLAADKINQIVDDLPPALHAKLKGPLILYGANRGEAMVQAYARFYPQNTFGTLKLVGKTFVLTAGQNNQQPTYSLQNK